jgi:aspartate racemase
MKMDKGQDKDNIIPRIIELNMKTIGLIGGMSWNSSLEYYRIINETIKEKLGELHSAKCILYSVDLAEIEHLQHEGKWKDLTEVMIDAAQKLERANAEFVVICTNTMHKMADDIQNNINIPILHIVDAVAERILDMGLKKVGLLGTRFTMEGDFYKKMLKEKHDIETIIPDNDEREMIHDVIYNELCRGTIKRSSRERFEKTIKNLNANGAEGVILGCTEIPLLIKEKDVDIPLFDTAAIHARSAVEFALE